MKRNFGVAGRRPRLMDNTSLWPVYKFLIMEAVLIVAVAGLVMVLAGGLR
jgi:hypothetical protein